MTQDTAARIDGLVRDVTAEEVEFYEIHGWVKLEGLINVELASEILEEAGPLVRPQGAIDTQVLDGVGRLVEEGKEPFRALVLSAQMGRNAQRLMNRTRLSNEDVAVRYRDDLLVRKPGGGKRTSYHQDYYEHSPDRGGEMMFWLALNEVTPEMGSMNFLSGSHKEGPLGGVDISRGADLLDLYPKLTEIYEMSDQVHYQAGDATVHHGLTIHGTSPNVTDKARYGYIFMYGPADARYFKSETPRKMRSGDERVTLDDPWFEDSQPIVHP